MRQLRVGAEAGSKARFGRVDARNTHPLPQPDRLAICLEPTRDNGSSAYICLSPHNGTLHVAPKDSAYGSHGSYTPERYHDLGHLIESAAPYHREIRCGR